MLTFKESRKPLIEHSDPGSQKPEDQFRFQTSPLG